MAHNSGFYQAQGQPQQPQYSPVFQQPQNIYQQLGKPQPQPHLQSHPTYTPQQQPVQSQGFQFSQQQYQPPYQLTPSPYSAPQTPYPPSQTPYVTSQTPFAPPQTPYQLSPTPYTPSQTPYAQPQPALQYPIQQQPVYTPQSQVSHAPTSSFPNQTPAPGAVPTSSSGSSWRLPSTRPPPVALSASLAQQAQSQAQVQAPPQPQPQAAPPTPGRRPLPQPTPGANAKPPALPPANSPQRIPTLPNVNTPTSTATSKPFPKIQTGQAYVAPSSKTPSPTRSRPLPTPAGGANAKRTTVDLGKLPHGLSNIVPSLGPATGSSTSSGPDWLTQKRSTSPTKGVQPTMMSSFPERKTAEAVGLLKTSNYAITNSSQASSSNTSSVPPKRRASPPRFQSQPNSESSSPTKDNPPANSWNNNTPSAKLVPTSSSSINATTANSTNTANPAPSSSSSTSTATAAPPPKKFIPMWKRTIPEMPAPAWGYAAGMVSEPHPKPKPAIPASQAMPPPPVPQPPAAAPAPAQTKGKGKLKKKQAEQAPPSTNVSQYTQPNPTAQRNWQPYQQQQPQPQPAQYAQQAGYGARGHITQPQQEEEDDEDEEETEEDEEDEEDDDGDEEEEETEEDGSDYPTRYAAHTRQYNQPLASERPQAQSRGRYEYTTEEETPKKTSSSSSSKKVLRPKTKPTTSTVDGRPRKMKSVDEGYVLVKAKEAEAKVKVRPKGRNRASDVEEERTPRKRITREAIALRKHERSQSAFEEREVVRHRREPGERKPGSAFTSGERRKRKNDSDSEGYATLAYLDSEEDDEEEEEMEIVWKKKTTPKKIVVRAREREEEVDWDRRGDARNRRQASSPQHGIRDLPPSSRRSGSTPGTRYSDGYESDDYRPSRTVVSGKQQDRQYRDDRDLGRHPEREPPRNRSAGLPQPPAMVREVAGGGLNSKMRAAPRMNSAHPKYEDEYEEDDRRHQQESSSGPLHMRFTAMNINGDGTRSDSRGSSSSAAWPVDLPRLPRTPGSSTTPGVVSNHSGGYFDMRPQSMNSPTTNTDFSARQQQPVRSQGEMNKHMVMQNQSRGMNMNLSLDDPPPRATVIRTPSPGPSGYTLRRELPQPQGRTETTQGHVPENAAQQLQRRQSMYSAPPSAPDHHDGGGGGSGGGVRRPQSQAYSNAQMPSSSFGQAHPAGGQQNRTRSEMSNQLGHASFNAARHQPQTPAPLPTVGIESPHPVGGRDRRADIPKLESDSNDGSDTEYRRRPRSKVPRIQPPPSIPMINVNASPNNTGSSSNVPLINIDPPMIQIDGDSGGSQRQQRFENNNNSVQVFEVPGVSVSGPDFDDHGHHHHGGPGINISGPDDYAVVHRGQGHGHGHGQPPQQQQHQQHPSSQSHMGRPRPPGGSGLICGGCHGPIIGRIVSAMGSRYHPACFKCTVCNALLEHVSSYEHEGQPYCHLDYHENFAPKCYSCKTSIIEEQFISLDDPSLGKRAYHTQHFFCAECGDPFLSPSGALPTDSKGELALSGDGDFEGFTVYKGHPYCEACHVRLRLPKCKRCKRSIRDNDEAVEALGGKWCWACFVCASCNKPFDNPSFFQRGDQPYCEHCFSVMLRNEI